MSDVRVAVIGLGDIGRAHAKALDETAGAELLAVCDIDPGSEAHFPLQLTHSHPARYTDWREVISHGDVDAVLVAVPDHLHREIAVAALDAGKHLFLEKPVANTLADADAIIAAARRARRAVQIGLVYRCSLLYRAMARLAREELGGPTLMWCKELRQCFPPRQWFYRQDCTGGTLVEKDCHHFDLFNWMIADEPVRVFATGGQHVWRRGEPVEIACDYSPLPPATFDDIDVVDHALVTIDYARGAKAMLILCMYLVPHNLTPEGLEVGAIGRNGQLLQATRDRELVLTGGREAPLVRPIAIATDSVEGSHIGFRRQHAEFLHSIRAGKEPAANLALGRQSILVALAAEHSIRTGQPVDVHAYDAEFGGERSGSALGSEAR
jgi:predicted dehydrogenase